MIILGWFLGVMAVYVGLIAGKSLIFLLAYVGGDFLEILPGESVNNVLLFGILVIFGIVFARGSVTKTAGFIKGYQSCLLAGLAVGIGRIFSAAQVETRWDSTWWMEYAFPLEKSEWPIVAIAVGVMMYHTIWGEE